MPIFKINNSKLEPISEKKIDLERDIQRPTEQNLETVFGLKFVCGALNQEFCVRVNEQDFYIDTVGFDESEKSIFLIEYKKEKSFSIIDQGFAYLSAMLNNKAEFVLEINERLNKKYSKRDINWEQSRIIFISNEFTNYQKSAINFKDLPMMLYKVRILDNGLIDYDEIKPHRTSESINKFIKDKKVQAVSREIKVYGQEDHFKPDWNLPLELFNILRQRILELDSNIIEKIQKHYIVFKASINGQQYNFCEIVAQASGLMIHLDIKINEISDPAHIVQDCLKVGHWATGNTKFRVTEIAGLEYAMTLIEQAHNDVIGKNI